MYLGGILLRTIPSGMGQSVSIGRRRRRRLGGGLMGFSFFHFVLCRWVGNGLWPWGGRRGGGGAGRGGLGEGIRRRPRSPASRLLFPRRPNFICRSRRRRTQGLAGRNRTWCG